MLRLLQLHTPTKPEPFEPEVKQPHTDPAVGPRGAANRSMMPRLSVSDIARPGLHTLQRKVYPDDDTNGACIAGGREHNCRRYTGGATVRSAGRARSEAKSSSQDAPSPHTS